MHSKRKFATDFAERGEGLLSVARRVQLQTVHRCESQWHQNLRILGEALTESRIAKTERYNTWRVLQKLNKAPFGGISVLELMLIVASKRHLGDSPIQHRRYFGNCLGEGTDSQLEQFCKDWMEATVDEGYFARMFSGAGLDSN